VERRQKIHEPDYWLVPNNQSQGTIHISHGSTLQVTWGERLLPIFRGLDASGFYSRHFRHRLQLGAIISKQLSTCIIQAQVPKEGDTPTFYMASYLVEFICTRNAFAGMNLNWHSLELAVHVYFNILWENRYKKSYAIICDQFIAHIYFLLFRKECPRFSDKANKVIAKIGHWYLDERETYIRVFGVEKSTRNMCLIYFSLK
jgi:hypothetical protein